MMLFYPHSPDYLILGRAYLRVFQDLCIKHVVGWQVRADMLEALVNSALQWALLA